MKTLIAIPCMDNVAAPFAHSLATMEKTGECVISMNISSLIYDARNQLAAQALKAEAEDVNGVKLIVKTMTSDFSRR